MANACLICMVWFSRVFWWNSSVTKETEKMYFSAIQNSDVYQVMTIETKSVSLDENSSSILSHYVSLCVKYHYGSCKNMIYSKLIFFISIVWFSMPIIPSDLSFSRWKISYSKVWSADYSQYEHFGSLIIGLYCINWCFFLQF